MQTHTETRKIESFKGKTLPTPIEYTFSYDTYANKGEAVEANKWPADADTFVLAKVNSNAKNSANSVAYQQAVKDLQAEYEKTPEFQREQIIASIKAAGKSQEEAEAFADSILG